MMYTTAYLMPCCSITITRKFVHIVEIEGERTEPSDKLYKKRKGHQIHHEQSGTSVYTNYLLVITGNWSTLINFNHNSIFT